MGQLWLFRGQYRQERGANAEAIGAGLRRIPRTAGNLRAVVKIASEFKNQHSSFEDLVQEGNIGLMQAIDRFDPEVGVRLPTYAAWWIRAYKPGGSGPWPGKPRPLAKIETNSS